MYGVINQEQAHEIFGYLRQPERWHADALSCAVPEVSLAEIGEAITAILSDGEYRQRLLQLCTALFGAAEEWRYSEWQKMPRDNSVAERFFFLLPLLWRFQWLRDFYTRRQIPISILNETLADIPRWMGKYFERHGVYGVKEVNWLRRHFRGILFTLGRLQFEFVTLRQPVAVLQKIEGDEIVVVATCGSITPNGLFAGCEGQEQQPRCELKFEQSGAEIVEAHEILPGGRIALRPRSFEKGKWRLMFAPGDPALALHIPAGGPMDFDACCDSFQRAERFFPRYFGDRPAARAVICHSWLLYPGLDGVLAPETNIVRFQRQFRLYPLPAGNADQSYDRIFAVAGRDLREVHLRSSLQRNMYAHIQQGGVPNMGGALFLPPFSRWGRGEAARRDGDGRG